MAVFMTGADYLALPRPAEAWVVQDFIPVGGSAELVGAPKAGKSFAALGIAMAVANGDHEWLGYPVLTHGPVAYLQIDTTRSLWTRYLAKVTDAGHDPSQIYFADRLLAPMPFNILDPEHRKWLKFQLEQIQPILFIVDVLREIHTGDENESTIMKGVMDALLEASGPAALLLLHHGKKEGQFGPGDIAQAGRGSNYINGKVDFVGQLTGSRLETFGRSENRFTKSIKRARCGLVILDGEEAQKLEIMDQVIEALKGETQTKMAEEYIARLLALPMAAPAESTAQHAIGKRIKHLKERADL